MTAEDRVEQSVVMPNSDVTAQSSQLDSLERPKNGVLKWLTRLRLDRTVYPFTLKGEDYLNSGWKRSLDIIGASITAPLWGSIALLGMGLMKLENSHLPTTIKQERFGQGNVMFGMLKIRSQEEDTSEMGYTKPTRVGRWLRKLSIDEATQFINVLRGDMTLVGRRPPLPVDYQKMETRMLGEIPYERARRWYGFTDEEWRGDQLSEEFRESVVGFADSTRKYPRMILEKFLENDKAKPGLTGLQQVMGRSNLSLEDRISSALLYERSCSLGFDIAILISTPLVALFGRGAR